MWFKKMNSNLVGGVVVVVFDRLIGDLSWRINNRKDEQQKILCTYDVGVRVVVSETELFVDDDSVLVEDFFFGFYL